MKCFAQLHSRHTITKKNFKKLEKYISKEGFEIISNQGVSTTDNEGVLHTPLINERECAYVTHTILCNYPHLHNDFQIQLEFH